MEFKDVRFLTAEEKRLVLKAWERFVRRGFQPQDFTDRLYHHLSQHCSFIAHYNRAGFYQTYFDRAEDTLRFISQFDSDKGCKSIEYGWSAWINGPDDSYKDINTAMIEVMGKHKEKYYKKLNDCIRARDIAMARMLLAKHGVE